MQSRTARHRPLSCRRSHEETPDGTPSKEAKAQRRFSFPEVSLGTNHEQQTTNQFREFACPLPQPHFKLHTLIQPDVTGAVLAETVARVAQLDRVTASEAAGCGFNSRHAH